MRKRQPLKIVFKNIYGDNPTPEQQKEIDERMKRAYGRIIKLAVESLLEKQAKEKALKQQQQQEDKSGNRET